MSRKLFLVLASAFLVACATDSDLMLLEAATASRSRLPRRFAIRVHLNQLKQLGGDFKSAEFQLFVSRPLKIHELCLGGWEQQLCADDADCIRRTSYSVTVMGRCVAQ